MGLRLPEGMEGDGGGSLSVSIFSDAPGLGPGVMVSLSFAKNRSRPV
jgi:hypothetical protein